MILQKKDIIYVDGSNDRLSWWYSPTAYIVKWTVVLSLFLIFFLWVTLGYIHARRRIRQGKPPMVYHRWLVPRSQRATPPQNNFAYYTPGSYGMQDQHMEPLPVYTNADMPPSYQPPPGGTKVSPVQNGRPAPSYEETTGGTSAGQQQSGVTR